jgi:hypothetical protein
MSQRNHRASITGPLTSRLPRGRVMVLSLLAAALLLPFLAPAASSAETGDVQVSPAVVPGVPGAPIAVRGPNDATVAVPPPTSGGTPTSITVTSNPGARTCSYTFVGIGGANYCTVTGLVNGTTYTFTARATNASGTSAASAASNAVDKATVFAPGTNLQLFETGQAFRFAIDRTRGTAGYAWVVKDFSPDLLKVDLATMTVVSTITVNTGTFPNVAEIAIDPGRGYAIVTGQSNSKWSVWRLNLETNEWSEPLLLDNAIQQVVYAVYTDTVNGMVYLAEARGSFGDAIGAKMFKVAIEPFSIVGNLQLGANENSVRGGVVSADGTSLFLASFYAGIVKVDLTTFSRVDNIAVTPSTYKFPTATIGRFGDKAIFATGDGSEATRFLTVDMPTFTQSGLVEVPKNGTAANDIFSGAVDPVAGVVFAATQDYIGQFDADTLALFPGTISQASVSSPTGPQPPVPAARRNSKAVFESADNLVYWLGLRTFSSVAGGLAPSVPASPQPVTAAGASREVSVNWTEPANTGRFPIVGYRVEIATNAGGPWSAAAGTCAPATTLGSTSTSCTATGLTNGTPYFLRVSAVNLYGTSAPASADGSVTPSTLPGVPGAPVAVASGTTTALVAVPPAAGGEPPTTYTVTSSPGDATCTITLPDRFCEVSGLSNGTAYTFTAVATNAAGSSAASPASNSITTGAVSPTPTGTPGAPTGVSGTAGDGQMLVEWTAPTQTGGFAITGYRVEQATSATGPWSNAAGTCAPASTTVSTATSCTATGLTNGTGYFFRVVAITVADDSDPSSTSDEVTPNRLPATPAAPSVVPGDGRATIAITPPTTGGTVDSYTVTAQPGGATCTIDPTADTRNCVIEPLTNGTPYTFTTTATNAIGTSGASPASTATPQAGLPNTAGVPGAPAAPTGTGADGRVTVNWALPTVTGGFTITGYRVEVATSDSGPWIDAAGTCAPDVTTISTTRTCSATGLTNGTPYFFRVTAISIAGVGSASTASNSLTPVPPAPGVPGAPYVTGVGDGSVTMTIVPPLSGGTPASYTVTASPGGATCTVTVPDTSCEVTGLTNATTYTFSATATNIAGTSTAGASSAGVVPGAPGVPGAPTATGGDGFARVTPTPPTTGGTPASYLITASPGGATCTVNAPATSCVVDGLDNNQPYTFTSVAINDAGDSTASVASAPVTPGVCGVVPTAFTDEASIPTYARRAASCLLIQGITTNNPYRPADVVTRAQMAGFLWRMAGRPFTPAPCGFTDAASIPAYAREAACWLKAEGITTNNPYRPADVVTRAQMAGFLWRFAGEPEATVPCGFSDAASIPAYARVATCWLKDQGITDNNPYRPADVVTRAQMAAFLYREGGVLNLWVTQ